MDTPILNYWPSPDFKPRKSQIIGLEWMQSLPADKKYILLEAPVGIGKSNMGINYSAWIARSFGNSFVLTPQKILQKQYEDSFDKKSVCSIYGKSNYTCESKKTNCDIGGDIKPICGSCPARDARKKALASPNIIMNYTLALLYFKFLDTEKTLPPRKLMIFDECHTLENHLTEFNSVAISELRCKKLKINYYPHTKINNAMEWIESQYIPALEVTIKRTQVVVRELEADLEFNPRKLSHEEKANVTLLKELKTHLDAVDFIRQMSLDEIKERFVLVPEQKSFKFRELYGRNVFHSLVKPMADKFLFMSSTILNKTEYCKELGLNPDEAAFLSLQSEFEVDNRPVYYAPQTKMNYGWDSEERRYERQNMLLKVKELCDLHKDDSGIIHTGSFKISDWLVEELTGIVPHEIFHHNPKSGMVRDQVIDEFTDLNNKYPKLLISPSITEGLDLKGDLSRFAIFVKVPFGNLGDTWTKRRMELSAEWYNRQALINIIQGCGRIVRSGDDWGVSYILDSSFNNLFNQTSRFIPKWWHDGFIKL